MLRSILQTICTGYVWEFSINLLGPKVCPGKAGKSSREKHQGKVSTRNRAERKIQMKTYIQSIQYYTHEEHYMPGARSPINAKIQVLHIAVAGSLQHGGCDTASFFYRTSPIILPWCPSKSELFCLSPTAFVLPHSMQLPPQLSFSSSRTLSFLNFEPLLTILKFLAPSTASVAFPSHMCTPHLTSYFPSVQFLSWYQSPLPFWLSVAFQVPGLLLVLTSPFVFPCHTCYVQLLPLLPSPPHSAPSIPSVFEVWLHTSSLPPGHHQNWSHQDCRKDRQLFHHLPRIMVPWESLGRFRDEICSCFWDKHHSDALFKWTSKHLPGSHHHEQTKIYFWFSFLQNI